MVIFTVILSAHTLGRWEVFLAQVPALQAVWKCAVLTIKQEHKECFDTASTLKFLRIYFFKDSRGYIFEGFHKKFHWEGISTQLFCLAMAIYRKHMGKTLYLSWKGS